jgi:hypothetical protein
MNGAAIVGTAKARKAVGRGMSSRPGTVVKQGEQARVRLDGRGGGGRPQKGGTLFLLRKAEVVAMRGPHTREFFMKKRA